MLKCDPWFYTFGVGDIIEEDGLTYDGYGWKDLVLLFSSSELAHVALNEENCLVKGQGVDADSGPADVVDDWIALHHCKINIGK